MININSYIQTSGVSFSIKDKFLSNLQEAIKSCLYSRLQTGDPCQLHDQPV